MLKPHINPNRFELGVENTLNRITAAYSRMLDKVMTRRPVIIIFGVIVLAVMPLLFKLIPAELAPSEDRGAYLMMAKAPDTPAVDYILTAGNKNGVRSYRVIAECSVGGKVIYSKPSDKVIVNLINQTVNLKITPVAGAIRYHIFNEDSNLIATLNKDVKTWTDNTTGEVYPISNIESYKYNVNQYYVEPSLIDIITKYEE
jgi:Cu/Ag efflux pump CusA